MITKEMCHVGDIIKGKWDEYCYWQGTITKVDSEYFYVDEFVKYNMFGGRQGEYNNYSCRFDGTAARNNFTIVGKDKKIKKVKTIKSWSL
jgi:hypothetical protein